MTGREWQPGDVLLTRGEVALATSVSLSSDSRIYVETASGRCLLANDLSADARPLVVLDPEDREQVERLESLLTDAETARHDGHPCASASCHIDSLQAALREFATPEPPKPDEPTGLGAVVEDAEGVKWVRIDDPPSIWAASGSDGDRAGDFAAIKAVKVLDDGYKPGEPPC